MTIDQYIDNINKRYRLGNATEHTFRGDLQQLIETLVPEVRATNEPKRQSCGAPDYILTRREIPVGFIEAKDIGDKDLEGVKKTGNKEQFDRYKASLANLIFTDYLDFHLYREGQPIKKIAIAEIRNGSIEPFRENFIEFTNILKDFSTHVGQTIKSPKRLAELMAGKARLLADVIAKALTSDEANDQNSTLLDQMAGFKSILIHDITPKGFADVYAQTIAYGLFAARLHDPTLPTFSRAEAAELIPKSNPFLRKLFSYIAGPDIDDRIKWIVDSLIEVFLACNVEELLKDYGKSTKTEDPIIHFYETFLSEYDPALRKARGVWYTPAPVVNFIVRAVDDILKTEFGLKEGLADTSKTKVKVALQATDKRYKDNVKMVEEEVHRVQILDPATGTGTFLAEVVKQVHRKFKGQQGIWSGYVENQLLPRLNGFELLMASYAMAHLQLDLLLKETGFKSTKDQRLKVYLTNSLEESHPDTGTLFANWLSAEANEANRIKRDAPVMCVIGNPPYSGESANKGEWIMKLMEDYKKEPGGKEKLKERNPKWVNDDYVKFLRYGQHFIEKNGSGVLAFINPHGFLDNPTFRGMRWNLLKTYDKIYTIDLHGNSIKKEVSPDGSVDINVFDIQQGVSINVFVKTGKKKESELGKVFHFDLYGKRETKYDFLLKHSINTIPFKIIQEKAPMFFMVQKDFQTQKQYDLGFYANELFLVQSMGITSGNDDQYVAFEKDKIIANYNDTNCKVIEYRPFDKRFINYDPKVLARARYQFMQNLSKPNFSISMVRRSRNNDFVLPFVTEGIVDKCIISTLDNANIFPLYLYPDDATLQVAIEEQEARLANLQMEIVDKIAICINHAFVSDDNHVCDLGAGVDGWFSPIHLLDYIYAVLYSPSYKEKYREFLKIDFPRVPYPKDADSFWNLVKLGRRLRELHLLESQEVDELVTEYPVDGNNIVTNVKFELYDYETTLPGEPYPDYLGSVLINETQRFDGVPQSAWQFYIGGYQPAQKWLKDRKGRMLSYEDILHYQRMIVVLWKTRQLMKEIDIITIE